MKSQKPRLHLCLVRVGNLLEQRIVINLAIEFADTSLGIITVLYWSILITESKTLASQGMTGVNISEEVIT